MKLLILLSRVPFPLDKGDKLRAYYFIRYLSEYHDIYLFCIDENKSEDKALNALRPYCKKIRFVRLNYVQKFINLLKALVSKLPFQVAYFYNKKIQSEVDRFISETEPDHIFCQLIRMAEYVKTNILPKTIDYQDVFSHGIKRRIEISKFYMKVVLNEEYKRLINYENEIFDLFDNKLIISEPDRNLIQHLYKDEIEIIANGVDFEYYKAIETDKEFDIVFTGNMAYPPNVDAAVFLVNEILPLVKDRISVVRVQIAGANPTLQLKQLQSENVIVTGWVDDMRISYANSKVFIAPMRIGTGLQNKLLEAMSMGIPCVSTPLSNNALNAKINDEILIGNSAEELAGCLIELLLDSKKRDVLSRNAMDFVKTNYSWEENIRKLNQIIIS